MTRKFETSPEQDAAIAWRVEEVKASGVPMTEDDLVAQFATNALADLVAAFKDAEASRIYAAFKGATMDQREQAKAALGL